MREKPREPSLSRLWQGEDTIGASKHKKPLLPSPVSITHSIEPTSLQREHVPARTRW